METFLIGAGLVGLGSQVVWQRLRTLGGRPLVLGAATLAAAGARLMTDTCSAISQAVSPGTRVAAFDSAKQAHYLPAIASGELRLLLLLLLRPLRFRRPPLRRQFPSRSPSLPPLICKRTRMRSSKSPTPRPWADLATQTGTVAVALSADARHVRPVSVQAFATRPSKTAAESNEQMRVCLESATTVAEPSSRPVRRSRTERKGMTTTLTAASHWRTVHEDGDDLIIDHCYIERRMTPLNLFIRTATPEQAAAKHVTAKKVLTDFTAKENMPWPQYYDGTYWDNPYGKQYGIRGIPAMFLLDKAGMVISTNARGARLEAEVKRLLAQ